MAKYGPFTRDPSGIARRKQPQLPGDDASAKSAATPQFRRLEAKSRNMTAGTFALDAGKSCAARQLIKRACTRGTARARTSSTTSTGLHARPA
eukprot:1229828-Pyramimonas_sp.AAC.1